MNETEPNSEFSFEKPPEELVDDGYLPKNPSKQQLKLEKEFEASLIRGAVSLVSQGVVPQEFFIKGLRPQTRRTSKKHQ